jgi:hypothetical protein
MHALKIGDSDVLNNVSARVVRRKFHFDSFQVWIFGLGSGSGGQG